MVSEQTQKIKRILFAEDEMAYRTIIQTILKKAGHQCVICINGELAINKLESEQFDLMILDYVLPGKNALEVIRWARDHNIQTPAIILTSYPSNELGSLCGEFTNVKILNKPELTVTDIPAIIEKAFI
jgi:DNA-binding response OmpR family regulator